MTFKTAFLLKILCLQGFGILTSGDLRWPLISKTIGIIYSVRGIHVWSIKFHKPWVPFLMYRVHKQFIKLLRYLCRPQMTFENQKNNRDHLLKVVHLCVKYELPDLKVTLSWDIVLTTKVSYTHTRHHHRIVSFGKNQKKPNESIYEQV